MKTYQINYDIPEDQKPTDKETVFTVSFMSRYGFVPKIRSGEKGITIRNTRKDGKLPQPGQVMRMWADQRSPERERIFESGELEPRCTGVWPVEISKIGNLYTIYSSFIDVFLKKRLPEHYVYMKKLKISTRHIHWRYNDKYRHKYQKVQNAEFSRLDGWDTPDEMFNFFKDTLPLNGFIYCWVKL